WWRVAQAWVAAVVARARVDCGGVPRNRGGIGASAPSVVVVAFVIAVPAFRCCVAWACGAVRLGVLVSTRVTQWRRGPPVRGGGGGGLRGAAAEAGWHRRVSAERCCRCVRHRCARLPMLCRLVVWCCPYGSACEHARDAVA